MTKVLSIHEVRDLLDYEKQTGRLTWKKRTSNRIRIGDVAGSPHGNGYVSAGIKGKNYYCHRLAFAIVEGRWPETVDHINGNRADNRWCNLREVSHLENHRNQRRRRNNKSGVMGVSWAAKDKAWRAYINVNGKQISLGSYKDKHDAIQARLKGEAVYGFHENHGSLTP